MGSWPCSLASASPSPASPFSRLPRGCEFAAVGSPGTASALGGKGHATPSNAPAGWDGHTACYGGKAAAWRHQSAPVLVGLGRTPRSRPAALRGIGTGAIPQPASLPCRSTAGREEMATNPWRAGFLLAFIFTDA